MNYALTSLVESATKLTKTLERLALAHARAQEAKNSANGIRS